MVILACVCPWMVFAQEDETDLQGLIASGRYTEAVPVYEEIVQEWRAHYREEPNADSRVSLSQTLIGLGHLLDSVGRPEDGVVVFQEARGLLAQEVQTGENKDMVGECLYGMGVAYQRLYRLDDAERCPIEAVKLW